MDALWNNDDDQPKLVDLDDIDDTPMRDTVKKPADSMATATKKDNTKFPLA